MFNCREGRLGLVKALDKKFTS